MRGRRLGILKETQNKDGLAMKSEDRLVIKGQKHIIKEGLTIKEIQSVAEQRQSGGGCSGKVAMDAWRG